MKNTSSAITVQDIRREFPFVLKNEFAERTILDTKVLSDKNGQFTQARLIDTRKGTISIARFWLKDAREYCYNFIKKA